MVTPAFVATSLVILLTPGPTNTVLATCGAAMGFRRGIIMPLAEAIGYVIAISFFVVFADFFCSKGIFDDLHMILSDLSDSGFDFFGDFIDFFDELLSFFSCQCRNSTEDMTSFVLDAHTGVCFAESFFDRS